VTYTQVLRTESVTQLDVLVADTLHRMDDAHLADGTYDTFIVWADARDDGHIAFDLTFTTGDHKGEMITVLARSTADPIALVGLPCTLFVEAGEPRIDLS
jgi:hypothetical protein